MTGVSVRSACLLGVLSSALGGCVYVPKTVETFDSTCKTVRKEMYLEPVQVASLLEGCRNLECKAGLALAGAITATSAVVSGSIVVAGNVVYWLESQGDCPSRKDRWKDRSLPGGWFSAGRAESGGGEFQVDMAAVRRRTCSPARADCVPKSSEDRAPGPEDSGETTVSGSPAGR